MSDDDRQAHVKAAANAYERGARALLSAVQTAYPVGCFVMYPCERLGVKYHQTGKVLGHGDWWYQPEYLRVENVRTGGKRRVPATGVVGVTE